MKTEVAKKETTHLEVLRDRPTWLGRGISTDQKIPRLLLMQGTSEFVSQEKAKRGDVVRSTTAEKVGGVGKNIPVIILSYPKHEWLIEVKTGKKFEFKQILQRDRHNADLPWSFKADKDGNEVVSGGFEAHRVRVGSFYAMLPSDMDRFVMEMEKASKGELPDLSVDMIPVQVRCRSFSYEASLGVESMLKRIAQFGRAPWEFILELSVKEMKDEDNTWHVFDFDLRQKGLPTPEKYKKAAKEAFTFVQANATQLIVDETSETSEVEAKATYSGGEI